MLLLFIAVSSLYTPPTGPRAGTESLRWQSPLTVAERLEALGVAWDPLATQWEHMYGLLAVYREREGHSNVPDKHVEDGEQLGGWLQEQRERHKARELGEAERKARTVLALSDEKVERLEALGVAWDPLATQRERMRGLLAVYRERVGDKEVVTKMLKDYNALLSFSSRWPSVWADPEMAAHPSHESVHS